VGTLEMKGKAKGKKRKRSKAQEVPERAKALQGESDMDKGLDEKWVMEMWAEFNVQDEGMVGY
jgi:hypothetical protein